MPKKIQYDILSMPTRLRHINTKEQVLVKSVRSVTTAVAIVVLFVSLAVTFVIGTQGFYNPYSISYPSATSLEIIPRKHPNERTSFSFAGPYLLELEKPFAGTVYEGPSRNTPGTPYISVVHFNGWTNTTGYRQNPGPQTARQYPAPNGVAGSPLPARMELIMREFNLWPFQLPLKLVIRTNGDKLTVATQTFFIESARLKFSPGFLVRMHFAFQAANQKPQVALFWYDGYHEAQSPDEERTSLRGVYFTNLVFREGGSFDLVERVLGG